MRSLLLMNISLVIVSYPHGAPNCGVPGHGTDSDAPDGVSLSMSGSQVTLSADSFRGFLLRTNAGLIWSTTSFLAKTSDACGNGETALTHTSSSRKNSISATVSCGDKPGLEIILTAHVVYSYETNYTTISKTFTCPSSMYISTPVKRSFKLGSLSFEWFREESCSGVTFRINTGRIPARHKAKIAVSTGKNEVTIFEMYEKGANKNSCTLHETNTDSFSCHLDGQWAVISTNNRRSRMCIWLTDALDHLFSIVKQTKYNRLQEKCKEVLTTPAKQRYIPCNANCQLADINAYI